MSKWTVADIPDQSGRIAVVTGANTGLGFETAQALADRGARVVLAVRNLDKGKQAAAAITGAAPRRRRQRAGAGPRLAGRRSARPPTNCAHATTASTC